ncbi:hypothetical protein IJG22_00840 [Candidatus Saccharibacteria bacterium]|nr:hypothetical protein [Candidatus Saccharibacteria bacterium]
MINVSDSFKAAAVAPVKRVSASIVIDPFGGSPTTITDADNLVSFTIESTGELFGSVATVATVKLLGSDYDLVGKTIRIGYGLHIDANNFEQIDYGYFLVTEAPVKKGAETTTIKAIGKMSEMQNASYETGITYPITIANLAAAIGNRFGLVVADMSSLPNYNYEIQEDLYENISEENYRNILSEIAGTTATMAVVDDCTQQIYFRPHQTVVQGTLDYEKLKTLTVKAHYGPVNSVVLSRTPQEDNIAITDEQSVEDNGLTEVKLANNEIMDDDRTAFIGNILNAVDGIEWTGFEATTVGLGWYECGDRVEFEDDEGNQVEGIITYRKITVDGGIKEELNGEIPAETTTNYALAGGVMKTIYNTEIKVDKQGQEIVSIVSRQDSFENQTNANFTAVTQNISSVVTSVQNSGGNNLIKNSAFYALDSNNLPLYWTLTGNGTWRAIPSADASANGSLSGQVIKLTDKVATQIVTVKPDDDSIPEASKTYYSFSCRLKKTAVGSATVTLSDGTQEGVWTISLGNNETSNYGEFAIEGILPHSTELTIAVEASDDSGIEFYVTDMMLAVGNLRTQWTQANGEFSNSQVQIDIDGVTIKNSNLEGTYTRQTSQAVEVYNNNQLAAMVSSEMVSAETGTFGKEIDMPPLKIVAQSDGWAFVKKED